MHNDKLNKKTLLETVGHCGGRYDKKDYYKRYSDV